MINNIKKKFRQSRLVSSLYWGLHLDDIQVELRRKSFDKVSKATINEFLSKEQISQWGGGRIYLSSNAS